MWAAITELRTPPGKWADASALLEHFLFARPSANRYNHRMFATARYCMVLLLAISMAGGITRCGCSAAEVRAIHPGDACCSHYAAGTGPTSCLCCQHHRNQPTQSLPGCHNKGHSSRDYCLHHAHRVKTDAAASTVLPGPFAAINHLIPVQYLSGLSPLQPCVAGPVSIGLARRDCSLLRQHCALII